MPISRLFLYVLLPLAALLAFAIALTLGSSTITPGEIVAVIVGDDVEPAVRHILALRLDRAASAFAVGGLLALAGLGMQVLLRNPLADPYVLGTSGGAAVAALGASLLGVAGLWLDLFAFAGALAATALVYVIASDRDGLAPERLLLTGIVLAAGFGAVISVLLALAPDYGLRGMLFWLMGDFSFSRFQTGVLALLAVAVAVFWLFARDLDVLARGARQAAVLGQAVVPVRLALFGGCALLTAVAVSTAGPIGFVGLVVPHLVRLIVGSAHRRVAPAACLAGGTLLVVADVLARTVAAPLQLPVGAITAVVGVPAFLILMQRRGRDLAERH